MLRMVFDLDGVIAGGSKGEVYSEEAKWAYEKCFPVLKTIDLLSMLKKRNVYITIHTARWESDRPTTEAWLKKFHVPYDELIMGKPRGHLYVDDRSYPKSFEWGEYTSIQAKAEAMLRLAEKNRNATRSPL